MLPGQLRNSMIPDLPTYLPTDMADDMAKC